MKLHLYKALKLEFKISLDRVVGDERGIYVGDSHQTVYALEPDDDRVRWQMPARGFEPRALAGDVLVLCGDRVRGLRGVDIRTGATRWTSAPTVTFDHCDTWRDGLLRAHAVSQPTEVRCIDPATGEVLEEILLDGRAALLGDERALYTHGESAGRCVDLRDRSVAWQRPVFDVAREAAGIPLDPRTHPLASFHGPDTVVVQYGPGLAAFRAATGETLWTARLPAAPHSSVAVALGCAMASTRQETIAFDVESGRIRWIRPQREAPADRVAEPATPPRQTFQGMFVSHEADGLDLVDAQSGQTLCSAPGRTFSDVAQAGDKLVALRWDGRVNVFGLERGLVTPRKPKPPPERKVVRVRGGGLAFEETARVKLPGLSWPSRAVLTADALVVSDPDHGVVQLARDGWRVGWQKPAGSPEIAWAVGGVVLAPLARRGRVVAYRAVDGETAWEAESQRGQAWILDQRRLLVAPSRASGLRVLDVETGHVLQTIDCHLPRVLCAAGGRIVLASTRPPKDELDAIRTLTDEPGVDQGVAEAILGHDQPATDALLVQTAGHFAVVDVEEGRAIWSRALEPELKEMAGLDGELRLQVVGADADWVLFWHWSHESYGSVLWGVSMVTGAVAWQARLEGRGQASFDGSWVWVPIEKPGFECVDVQTGALRRRHAPTVNLVHPVGSYGAYHLSTATRSIDFYHPLQETQRLPLANGTQLAVDASPELLLVERHRVRVLEQVAAKPSPPAR
jgi:outer membrane protein assembly factor BamB